MREVGHRDGVEHHLRVDPPAVRAVKGPERAETCVADQHVDAPEPPARLLGERPSRPLDRKIGDRDLRADAVRRREAGREVVKSRLAPRGEHEARTARGEGGGERRPDARRRPRDQRVLSAVVHAPTSRRESSA